MVMNIMDSGKIFGRHHPLAIKFLGWVGKELRIRGAGKSTLSGYKGWPRSVPNHYRINRVINDYFHDRGEAEEVEEAILSHVQVSSSASFPALILINTAGYGGEPMLLLREMMLQWTMRQNEVAYHLTYYHICPRGR
jgi:hypothetical protein